MVTQDCLTKGCAHLAHIVGLDPALLTASEAMGEKRVATRNGLAFVAQRTHGDVWHGYPEAWDKIDSAIFTKWLECGLITRRNLRQWRTRDQVESAWKELNDAGQ